MGKINVLGFDVANLIAAGEVVERPSSVLKELIENSIDAGATSIVAEIKRGGVSLIRVTDNGSGIEKDDLPVALQRHATSKIKDKDDLNSIMTLGFRGEALAAISSVSSVTIISKTADSDVGYMLTSEAGNVIDIEEVGCAVGTTVVVSELFYNVPARRKFLKKDSTEAMNVAALVEKVALSRPDISIQLLIDGEEKFKTPGDNDLYNTIYAIYGKQFASKMIKADGEASGITVRGFVGRSDNVKRNRNMMNIFINGRYVKSLTAQAAVERAYTSYIAPECFPACVLFIDINPGLVDVNVHPAKLEVKFADEKEVFEAVFYTVKRALEEHEYRPELELSMKKAPTNLLAAFVPIGENTRGEQISMSPPYIKIEKNNTDASVSKEGSRGSTFSYGNKYDEPVTLRQGSNTPDYKRNSSSMTPKTSIELLERYKDTEPDVKNNSKLSGHIKQDLSEVNIPEYKFIGEAFNCYVIIEYDGAVLLIDKHAAHERVVFEDLKRSRNQDGRIGSQILLLPITVIPGDVELSVAIEFKAELEAVGFKFTVNEKSLDIVSVPEAISPLEAENLFLLMLDELKEGKGNPKVTDDARRERALYQVACKAAIKGGRIYDRAILEWLIGKLLLIPDITVCPHGRPVAIRLTKAELDRQFERIK